MLLAAALAAYPVVETVRLAPLVDALAALGLLAVLAAPPLHRRFADVALSAFAVAYVVVDTAGDVAASSVVVYAVGLLLLAEVLSWTARLPAVGLADRSWPAARLTLLVALAAASALLGLVVLAASSLRLPQAFEAALLGSGAAVSLLALPVLLIGRGRGRRYAERRR